MSAPDTPPKSSQAINPSLTPLLPLPGSPVPQPCPRLEAWMPSEFWTCQVSTGGGGDSGFACIKWLSWQTLALPGFLGCMIGLRGGGL